MLSYLNVLTFKEALLFICTENDLKNDMYFNTNTISKMLRSNDFYSEVEPVEPETPVDEPNGSSGLDNNKYLELDELENGGYDLPSDADYTDDIGQKLLRYIKPGDIMYDSVGLGSSGMGSGHIAFIEGIAYSQRYQRIIL